MTALVLLLDLLILGSACLSSWLWWVASRNRVRSISRREVLDAADINRIVTALNRSQIFNSRAALSTGCAAILATLRLLLDAALLG